MVRYYALMNTVAGDTVIMGCGNTTWMAALSAECNMNMCQKPWCLRPPTPIVAEAVVPENAISFLEYEHLFIQREDKAKHDGSFFYVEPESKTPLFGDLLDPPKESCYESGDDTTKADSRVTKSPR